MYGCIIIDDPLIKENYGFLNYRKLLSSMDKHNFHTSIAFIPFNYKRTDKKVAALLRERPDRFSLCVHGCDHTKGEFGSTDPNYLDNKVKLATVRMIEHEKITGIPFDRIMVFPQGIFSNAALEALKRNKYISAINSFATPVSGQISSNFPLFTRHIPENVTGHVSDPILIVLHHNYFKDGYNRLTDFVDELNNRFNVTWDSLGNIIRSIFPDNEADSDLEDADQSGLKYYGYWEYIKILSRRYASEFRDNYLSKNTCLLNCANKAINFFVNAQ